MRATTKRMKTAPAAKPPPKPDDGTELLLVRLAR